MSFSEMCRMAKGKLELESCQEKITKCSNDPSFVPENKYVEQVWEKGQILMQGQSSSARKEKDPIHISKPNRKSGVLNEMGLNENDDLIPWLNYPPIDHQSLQHGYCSELSGVNVNELSAHNHFSSIGRRLYGKNMSIRSNTTSVTVQGNVGQQCQASLGSSDMRSQKQDLVNPSTRSVVMNFSHFSRPAALVQANLRRNVVERTGHKDEVSATNGTNLAGSTLVHSSNGLGKETSPSCQPVTAPQKISSRELQDRPLEEPVATKQSEFVTQEKTLKDYKHSNQYVESSIQGPLGGQKAKEPVVACPSVCSGNSIERPSDDATDNSKRKFCDTEDSEFPSEDAEEESMEVNRAARARAGTSCKRSRVAEVHNLSERRRRDRINEKMRALQELIPNCNKVDKASMLDEAIEYLKTLQLQIQIMSVGGGLYMPPMMLPPGMQQMHAVNMGHFSPMVGMGMGMGMGIGMQYGIGMPNMNSGSCNRPMIQIPSMQGAHFPGLPMAGSNHQLLEPPAQQLPIPMPHAPSIPLPAMGQNLCPGATPMQNLDSSSKDFRFDTEQELTSNAKHLKSEMLKKFVLT